MNPKQNTREQTARITLLSEAIKELSRDADCADTPAHYMTAIEVMASEVTKVAEQIELACYRKDNGHYLHLEAAQ